MAASFAQPAVNKKLVKKLRKHHQMLVNREQLTLVEIPSPILCVSNGGLGNGVAYEEIYPLFSAHGDCDILMIPRKSYCIICFASGEAGEAAYNALNGHKLMPDENRKAEVILYLAYIEKAPESLVQSKERPAGLILLEDFVSQEYADQIVQSVEWEDSPTIANQKELKHRRVKHYGYEFKYSINNVDPDDPLPERIPEVYKPLLEKLLTNGYVQHYPDQLTVNQYLPGQGIPPHVDTPSAFEDGLVSLSLGSQVIMEFRHPDGRQLSVLLPNRSALIMTGESRYVWSHGITPRKSDIISTPTGGLTLSKRGLRTSFTFRKITGVKPGEENSANPNIPVSEHSAAQLESEHVHKVYEEIADNFSGTRHTPWPRIADFLRQQPCGSVLVDIGCGNGKYFGINKQLYELGSDRSHNLAGICMERGFQVFVGDVLAIPVRSGMCDVCLCIAVIHHLSTKERRLKAVSELLRVLRPQGKALIYVWAMEQELNKVKSKYLKGKKPCQPEASDSRSDKTNKTDQSTHTNSIEPIQKKCEDSSGNTKSANIEKSRSDIANSCIECIEEEQVSPNAEKETGVQEVDSASGNVCTSDFKDSHRTHSLTCDTGVLCNRSGEDQALKRHEGKIGEPSVNERLAANEGIQALAGDQNNVIETSDKDTTTLNENQATGVDGEGGGICKGAKNKRDIGKGLEQSLTVHVNRTEFKQQDVLVPWQLKKKDNPKEAETYHRFYHVFQKGELEDLCCQTGTCRVVDSYYDQGNWAVILEKL